jgi:carboxyl-terminal processing protease
MLNLVRRSAAVALAVFCLAAADAPALPVRVAGDVQLSYTLLTSTAYRTVDPQALLAAAADALVDEAKKHGQTIQPPELKVESDSSATVGALDRAIASAADDAHASSTDFAYAAIRAMANTMDDRYTQFFTPDEIKRFDQALDPDPISGIGVMIGVDPATSQINLTYVVPGTPADKAGLQAGDLLTSIAGTPTKGMTIPNASNLLRGKTGSTVVVRVVRDGGTEKPYPIERAAVQPPTVVFRMLPGDIGYVYVMAFGKATPSEFDTAVARLKAQGAKAIALDLRYDGGGYVDSALLISSRFIANKALLTVEERGNRAQTILADNETSVELPVIVLVNQYTASASEITAAALQDDGIGQLVGTKTFGKGVVQTVTMLPDGAAIKITTAHYLTPNRRDINLKGIEPDLRVDENSDSRIGDVDHDAQLRAALMILQKKIAQAKTI